MCVFVCFSLQEVSSVPLRYMTQLVFNDPWSLLFMSTLGPQNYIKVQIFQKHLT